MLLEPLLRVEYCFVHLFSLQHHRFLRVMVTKKQERQRVREIRELEAPCLGRKKAGAVSMELKRKEHWVSQGKGVFWSSL